MSRSLGGSPTGAIARALAVMGLVGLLLAPTRSWAVEEESQGSPLPLLGSGGILLPGLPRTIPDMTTGARGRVWVDPDTGGLVVEHMDMLLPGLPQPLQLQRAWTDQDGWSWGAPGAAETWDDGRLVALSTHDGREITFSHPSSTSTSRPASTVRGSGGLEARYDEENGRLVAARSAAGSRQRYGYDADGRLMSILWGDGSRVSVDRNAAGEVTLLDGPGTNRWRFTWSQAGTLESALDAAGGKWRFSLGENKRQVTNPQGVTTTILLADGLVTGWTDGAGRATRLHRNPGGQLTGFTDGAGARWRIQVDSRRRLLEIVEPTGAAWRYQRNISGHLTHLLAPEGGSMRLDRDPAGRLKELARGVSRTAFRRDDAGLVREVVHGNLAVTRIERDRAGRITAVVDATGNQTTFSSHRGLLPGTITDPSGRTWTMRFDAMGRPVGVLGPDGEEVRWYWDPTGHISRIERGSAITRLGRRADGMVTRVEDALGRITGWDWSSAGSLSAWRSPGGAATLLERDLQGQVSRVIHGDTSYDLTRDPLGRLLAIRRATGPASAADQGEQVLAVERDQVGRVTHVSWPRGDLVLERDARGSCRAVELDGDRFLLERNLEGALTEVSASQGRWAITRDLSGLPIALEGPDGTGWALTRDPRGLPSKLQVGDLELVWSRDSDGRVTEVMGPGGVRLGTTWSDAGQPELVRFPGGELAWFNHHPHGVQARLQDASGRLLARLDLTLDALGRLLTMEDGDQRTFFRHGPRDELVTIEGSDGAWSILPTSLEDPQGQVCTLDREGRPLRCTPPPGPAWWEVATTTATVVVEDGRLTAVEGDLGSADLLHDSIGRFVALDVSYRGDNPPRRWRVRWDPFGRPHRVDGPTGPTDLNMLLGSIATLATPERQAAILEAPHGMRVMAGRDGYMSFMGDLTGGVLFRLGRDQPPARVTTRPGGYPDTPTPGPMGARGRLQLTPGGPLLGPEDALDPLTGQPTAAPLLRWAWQVVGWPDPQETTAWPTLDGSLEGPWSATRWPPDGPWAAPLDLMVQLGVIEPPQDGWWRPAAPPAPLPWLSSRFHGGDPPLGPPSGALPLELDPLTALFMAAALPPTSPVAPGEPADALLGAALTSLPDPIPGMASPAGLPADLW